MDPKLFSVAQQSMAMNNQPNQPNPNMMMSFQQQQHHQQQQQQQQQSQDMQQFNPLSGTGLGGAPFNPVNLGTNLGFGQNDFSLDQTDLNSMNPFIQANPSLMNGMNVASLQQQQQHLRQTSHPQSVYSPQNLMNLGNNQGKNTYIKQKLYIFIKLIFI